MQKSKEKSMGLTDMSERRYPNTYVETDIHPNRYRDDESPKQKKPSVKPYVTVELQPFTVPSHVYSVSKLGLKQDGFKPLVKYELSELDAETLDVMCDTFRASVFEAAGVEDTVA